MLQGLTHLHSLNISHRDVKPENFLVGGRGGETVKLGDFGLAAIVPEGGKVAKVCGTPQYMSPEMLLQREADLKADVWSFGVIAYVFLCGNFPYVGKSNASKSVHKAIAEGSPPFCDMPWLTTAAAAFLYALLDRDPCTRPSATAAQSLPLMRSADQAQHDLRPRLLAAEEEGFFDSPDLSKSSVHDDTLIRLQDGDIERSGKALTQIEIDAFFETSPENSDQQMEAFLFATHSNSKVQEEKRVSEASTADTGFSDASPKISCASTPSSLDFSYRAAMMLTNSIVSVRSA
jgi:serine/threonine protein kinase